MPHLIEVTDPADPRLADYARLTDVALRQRRDVERGIYLAESSLVVERAVAAGHRPISFLLAPRWLEPLAATVDRAEQTVGHEISVFVGAPDVLEQLTGFHLHRGALAAVQRPPLPSVEDVLTGARRVAVLEDVVDHTNLGAVARSAAALGLDALLVSPRCADPLYRRSVRVSMGAVLQLPWTRLEEWPGGLDRLRAAGFVVAALALDDDAVPLDEVALAPPERLALLLGAEGPGLSQAALAAADVVVRIPMAGGVDSLNVAAAAAVAFWALRAG